MTRDTDTRIRRCRDPLKVSVRPVLLSARCRRSLKPVGRTAGRDTTLWRDVLQGDRGAVTAELVVATPVLLLMLMAIVQFALWSHATHTAQAAASQGLAATRAQGGTVAAGNASAQAVLDQLARGPLTDVGVTIDRNATRASVQIRGCASSVLPFLRLPVHAEAAGPVERFVPNVYEFRNSQAVSGGNPSVGGAP